MLYRFVFSFALVVAFAFGAYAAPSVRVLGNKTNAQTGATPVRASNFTASKNTGAVSSRPASIRTVGASTVRPVGTVGIRSAQTGTGGTVNTNRLSVGKYLHNGGVASGAIKPVTSVETVENTNRTIDELVERISALELDIVGKQNILSTGTGLYIEDNKLNLSGDIAGLVERMNEMQQQMAGKADTEYVTQQITQQVNQKVIEQNNKIYDANTGELKYVGIVDVFSPEIFDDLNEASTEEEI